MVIPDMELAVDSFENIIKSNPCGYKYDKCWYVMNVNGLDSFTLFLLNAIQDMGG